MRALAQQLLRGPSPLSPAERELIATFVSAKNGCNFCTRSHAAVARKLGDPTLVDRVLLDPSSVGERLHVLLEIAEVVRASVTHVPDALIERARSLGYDDVAIHDTVLVAAAFSMFNRYVDGLRADTPDDGPAYVTMAERLTTQGYVPS